MKTLSAHTVSAAAMIIHHLHRSGRAFIVALAAFAVVASSPVAAQDEPAIVLNDQDEQAAIVTPVQPALLQTTTLPWAFGDEYVAVSALPVAGNGPSEPMSLPLFTLLIGAIVSAGGAIVVRARHAG
jgi:DNA-binding beta-propeller fold protein YncE